MKHHFCLKVGKEAVMHRIKELPTPNVSLINRQGTITDQSGVCKEVCVVIVSQSVSLADDSIFTVD